VRRTDKGFELSKVAWTGLGTVAALSLAACGAGATATSSTPATESLRAEVAQAFTYNTLTSSVPADEYEVTDVRVAGSDPRWTTGRIRATSKYETDPPARFVMHRQDAGRWELVSLGDDAGVRRACGTAPKVVLTDLGVDCSGPTSPPPS
jgi:hypothetical protein